MPALPGPNAAAMLTPMPDASTSTLLEWFAAQNPDRTHRAGRLVFIDLDAASAVIDRAEAAGMSVRSVRGFAVVDAIATPIEGQTLTPAADGLLDCETPSGATCGVVRRTLRWTWAATALAAGRHMVLLDFDDDSTA